MAVFSPSTRTQKPQGAPPINRGTRLASGLVLASSCGTPGVVVNQVDGNISATNVGILTPTSRAGATGPVSNAGAALQLSSSAITTQFNSTYGLGTAGVTILCGVYNTATGGFDHGCLVKVGNASTGYGVGVGVSTWDAGGASQNLLGLFEAVRWIVPPGTETIFATAGDYIQAGLIIDSTGLPGVILNGRTRFTASGTGAVTPAGGVTYFGGYQANRYPLQDLLDYVFIWNRALTAAEIASVYANPWQLFLPPVADRYFVSVTAADNLFAQACL